MSKKVSMREIVAVKTVFAALIAGYYWLWSRGDWQPYYSVIQRITGICLVLMLTVHAVRVNKYKKEQADELAEQNLRRCDSICLKVFIPAMLITAYIGGILGHVNAISTSVIGWIIVITIFVLSIFRTILFIVMDTKGV